jgi:hypothetical protein
MKNYLFLYLFFSASALFAQTALQYTDVGKQRIIVLTDITNEPDDQQSLVRFLVYANEFDIEGMVATTSVHLKDKVKQDKIEELITAYGKVRNNLEKHAKGYPTESYLKNITRSHLPLYGMSGVGKGKDSGGSELIISRVDKADNRPLWISVWGGANCLAQALWKVKETRTKEEVNKFVSKLRVYTISDQDDSGRWIRNTFPGIFFIVSPSSERWEEYYKATWTGISGDRHYKNGPMYKFELVDNPWLTENIIRNHGPLGELYPKLEYIMEGDTPSFLGLINNGLGSALSPAYGGWGGRYDYFQSYAEVDKIWTNTIHSMDEIRMDDGSHVSSDQATIWRWREAFQHDFAARMDWCVASSFNGANHNPEVSINGNKGKAIATAKVPAGSRVRLSAKGTLDPDNHSLSYRWFVYKEAGRFTGNLRLETPAAEEISFAMLKLETGQELHIICEVQDDGNPALFAYRRIILQQ